MSVAVQVGPGVLHAGAEAMGAHSLAERLGAGSVAEAAIIRRGLITRKGGATNYRVSTFVTDDTFDEVATVRVTLEREDGVTWTGQSMAKCTRGNTVPQEGGSLTTSAGCGVFALDVAPEFLGPDDAGDDLIVSRTLLSSSGGLVALPTIETVVVPGPAAEPAPTSDGIETLVRVPVLDEDGWRAPVSGGDFVTLDPVGSPTAAIVLQTTLADGAGQIIAQYSETLTESTEPVAIFEGPLPNGNGNPTLVVHLEEAPPSQKVRTFHQMTLGEERIDPLDGLTVRFEATDGGLASVAISNPSDPTWDPDGQGRVDFVLVGGTRLHVRSSIGRSWDAGVFEDHVMLSAAAGYSMVATAFDEAGDVIDSKSRPAWQSLASDRPVLQSVEVLEDTAVAVATASGRPTASSLSVSGVDLDTGVEVLFGDLDTPSAAERQFAATVDLGVSGAEGATIEGLVTIEDATGAVVDQAVVEVVVGADGSTATSALGHAVWVVATTAPEQGASAANVRVAYAGDSEDHTLWSAASVTLADPSDTAGPAVTAILGFDVEFAEWTTSAGTAGSGGDLSVSVEVLDALGDGDGLLDPEVSVPAVMYSFGKGTEKTTSQVSSKPQLL